MYKFTKNIINENNSEWIIEPINKFTPIPPICIATMLRRIILTNVPTLAILYYNDETHDKIYIVENKTCLDNGFIKHRLSTLPFNIRPDNTNTCRISYKSNGQLGNISTHQFLIEIDGKHKPASEYIPDIYFHRLRTKDENLEFQASLEISCGEICGAHSPSGRISAIPIKLSDQEGPAKLTIETIEGITNYNPTHVFDIAIQISITMIELLYDEVMILDPNTDFETMKWQGDYTKYTAYKITVGGEKTISRLKTSPGKWGNTPLLPSKVRCLVTIAQVLQEFIVASDSSFIHISYMTPHPLKKEVTIAMAFENESPENAKKKLLEQIFNLKDYITQNIHLKTAIIYALNVN
tara:strand:- start:2746 stop:3801 length:1056 start_codon:yes stop_codon:yes gene_type:complete